MSNTLRPVLSIRMYKEGKSFGPGIAELLTRVNDQRSLRSAAASMHMAYSKAWRIVKDTERSMGMKLLNSMTGGQHGGGAELTDEALRLLLAYNAYVHALKEASDRLFQEVFLEIFEAGEG